MLTAILFSVIFQSQEIPQAAFTARVYLPGKTRSYYDVYLWRGPELGAERIATTKTDLHNLRWLDRNRLEWTEHEGDWDSGMTRRKVEYDLSDFTSKIIDEETLKPRNYWRSTGSRDNVVPPQGRSYKDSPQPEFVGVEPTGVEIPTDENPSHISIFEFKGKRLRAGMSYHGLARFVPGRSADEFFLYDGTFASSVGSWAGLWRMDFESGEVEQIIEGPTEIEFHPDTPFWCGSTSRKWMVDFEGMALWQEKGFVGNWHTGEVWNVMQKPSFVSSISLRPQR